MKLTESSKCAFGDGPLVVNGYVLTSFTFLTHVGMKTLAVLIKHCPGVLFWVLDFFNSTVYNKINKKTIV